jgi:two-component system phosphate regulon sensor histidine kinase PhoR
MPRSRFFWRLYVSYAALIVLATLLGGVLVTRRVEEDSLRDLEASLEAKAILLQELAREALAGKAVGPLAAVLARIGVEIDVRLTIVRADGTVIADSSADPAGMENHAQRDEIVLAAKADTGTATRPSRTVGVRMMYHARAVRDGDRLLGFARAALSVADIDRRLSRLRLEVFLGGLLTLAMALVVGAFVAQRLTKPLSSMTDAAQSIAAGDYGRRVAEGAPGEVGQLARAFNRMAAELTERIEIITRENNKLMTILAGMVEGVVAVNTEGCILHMNTAAGAILGAFPPTSTGKRLWEVTSLHAVSDILGATLREGREERGETRLEGHPDAKVIEIQSSPLKGSGGELAGAVVLLHDVTRLRKLELIRRDFVANVSHELKTPVTAIHALVETLSDAEDMDAETRTRFLGKVQKQSERLSALVSDLLTLSRVESQGEKVVEREPLDLRQQVLECEQRALPLAQEKGVEVDLTAPQAPVTVLGEVEAIRAIVDNLLDNAVKYTPGGGRVELCLSVRSDRAVIEVSDNGIGIEAEHLDRIFERFYRVDKARSRELGGTGLGLSIVKHFVAALGGEVSVQSTLGKGSTFRVEIPLAA